MAHRWIKVISVSLALVIVLMVCAVGLGAYESTQPVLKTLDRGVSVKDGVGTTPSAVLVSDDTGWAAASDQIGIDPPKNRPNLTEGKLVVLSIPTGLSGGQLIDVQAFRTTGDKASLVIRRVGVCGGLNQPKLLWSAVQVQKHVNTVEVTEGKDLCRDPRSIHAWLSTHLTGDDY